MKRAAQLPNAARAPVAAQPTEQSASANVATREEVWRRRNWLRLAWLRNQSWIMVADPAPISVKIAAIMAANGDSSARQTVSGPKTKTTTANTASTYARVTCLGRIGAEAMRSGASSPEMASQARPPASCPAAMINTGTSSAGASMPAAKLRHSNSAGGSR